MRALVVVALGVVAGIAALVFAVVSVATVGDTVVELAHGKTRPQGGIYTGCYSEPRDLNPFTTRDLVAQRVVLQFTHEALLDWDPDTGALRPALAVAYEQGPDDRSWVFPIREGVRFSDGQPLTDADVVFPFEVSRRTKVPMGNLGDALGLIEAAEVRDRRLLLRLRYPGLSALSQAATGYLVMDRAWFLRRAHDLAREQGAAKTADIWDLLGAYLPQVHLPGPGTGPYRLGTWRRGRDLQLVQNPCCWRHAARPDGWNLAGMRVLFVQEPAARLALLRQGAIDIFVDSNVRNLLSSHPELAATYRVCIYDQLRGGNFVLVWNHRRRFLGDPRVRRALTMCFDREAIATGLMAGQGKMTSTWFAPGSAEAQGAPEPLPHDPAAAGRLLAEAGVDGDHELALSVVIASGQPLHRRILELAQPALQDLPVKLRILPMEWAAMSARLKAGDFDGMLLFMSLDPVEDPFPNFHSSQAGVGLNRMGYANPEVDRLLEQARRTSDPDQRRALYARFNEIFHEDQPLTLLVYPLTGVLLHKRFRDAEPNKLGLYPERWWVEPVPGR